MVSVHLSHDKCLTESSGNGANIKAIHNQMQKQTQPHRMNVTTKCAGNHFLQPPAAKSVSKGESVHGPVCHGYISYKESCCSERSIVSYRISINVSMASNSPNDPRKPEEVDQINNPQSDRNDVDIFQDASDILNRATPLVTREQEAGCEHDPDADADAEPEDPNKDSQLAQACYDDEESQTEYKDGREDEMEEREGGWAGYTRYRQENPPPFNPDILPEQQEIQDMYLVDVLHDLPPDLATDPDAYRRELVKRGVAEDLIKQQEEHLARYNANKRSRPESSDWETLPAEENSRSNAAAWNATLPTRSAQQDPNRDPTRYHIRKSWQQAAPAAATGGDEPHTEHQQRGAAAPNNSSISQQEPVVSLYASIRLPISSLVVVDESGDVLHIYERSELRIATVDPATECLRVETRRRSGW
jgi:hypothetical protein